SLPKWYFVLFGFWERPLLHAETYIPLNTKKQERSFLVGCWCISVIHCPYCHGYEVRNEVTGILGDGEPAYDFTWLIYNWTKDLTLFTNGSSTLTGEQKAHLTAHNIEIVEKEIERLVHTNGQLKKIIFNE